MELENDQRREFGYLDFELQIGLGQDGAYPVEVLRSPAGEASTTLCLPFSAAGLDEQLQALERTLLDTNGESAIRSFGQVLFDALFTGDVQDRYVVSLPQAAQARKGLRIKLRIQAPELARLPWEFLYDARMEEFVSLSKRTPVVRYLELPQPAAPLAIEPPLCMLAMIASPRDLPPLNIKHERERLEGALKRLIDAGAVSLDWIEGQTYHDLQRALQSDNHHIFHFIGHGGFDREAGEGIIALCDDDGNADRIRATDLSRLLADQYALRLVMLNACQGAQVSESNMFSSTATRLIKRGVPAVVAMQYAISDAAAIAFASAFYEALASQLPIDGAMSYARTAMCRTGPEWGTPVLYTHAPDGILFQQQGMAKEVQTPAQAEPAPAPLAAPAPEPATGEPATAPAAPAVLVAPARPPITPGNAIQLQLLQTLAGHTKRINRVAVAPDNQLIVSASGGDFFGEEQGIRLWQVADGTQLNTTIRHEGTVWSVAFAPDGKMLASGGIDRTVRLWSIPSGRPLPVEIEHPEWVLDVAFAPDGQTLATACADDIVRLWRVAGGSLLREFKGHTNDVTRVAFAPDRQTIASASMDQTVRLWQVADGSARTLTGHTDRVLDVAFSPDGQTLASTSADMTACLWRVSDGVLLHTLKGGSNNVNGAAFSPDGQILATSCGQIWSGDYVIRLWLVADGSALGVLQGHTKSVMCVAFSPDGTLIVSGAEDATVRIWGCI